MSASLVSARRVGFRFRNLAFIPMVVACSAGVEPGTTSEAPALSNPEAIGPAEVADEAPLPVDVADLELIGRIEGSFDGEEFTVRRVGPGDSVASADDVGTVRQTYPSLPAGNGPLAFWRPLVCWHPLLPSARRQGLYSRS
jgi:hypothetical protein